jgi:transcriptional regulator with XRE-family HTH domain
MSLTGSETAKFGAALRVWRERRRLSQLSLAAEANVSQRHLSFIESGRASPSRAMVIHLAEALAVPLRDRNALLISAGFAPVYKDRSLDDPVLAGAMAAVGRLLKAQEPYPALAVDRGWCVVAANAAVAPLIAPADPELVKPPINVMRLSLHPRGLAPLIVNLAQWRAHLIERLRRQLRASFDPAIERLLREVEAYPAPGRAAARAAFGDEFAEVAVPLRIRTPHGVLSFLSSVCVFGTALDVTLAELSLELFFPEDEATAAALRGG